MCCPCLAPSPQAADCDLASDNFAAWLSVVDRYRAWRLPDVTFAAGHVLNWAWILFCTVLLSTWPQPLDDAHAVWSGSVLCALALDCFVVQTVSSLVLVATSTFRA